MLIAWLWKPVNGLNYKSTLNQEAKKEEEQKKKEEEKIKQEQGILVWEFELIIGWFTIETIDLYDLSFFWHLTNNTLVDTFYKEQRLSEEHRKELMVKCVWF